MFCMPKTTSINLRITPEFRRQIEELAEYHGLSLSSYAHSLLVKAVRRETEAVTGTGKHLAPVVAHIEPSRDEVRRRFEEEVETVGTRKIPVLKKKVR